jgi:RNA polymerase sigma factor (TIGR02999 family)
MSNNRCAIVVSDVTRILAAIEAGDSHAATDLLPFVYDELRRLAAARLSHEKPGHLLQATALVNEAYIRLVDTDQVQHWTSRWHFFAAAGEAMRRILVENARRRQRLKHGGGRRRVPLNADPAVEPPDDQLLALDEGLEELARTEPQTAELVKRHYFAGLTLEQAAESLGLSPRTGYRLWAYARAWLYRFITRDEDGPAR